MRKDRCLEIAITAIAIACTVSLAAQAQMQGATVSERVKKLTRAT